MRQCAFLTMDSLEDFHVYDDMTYAPLAARGWQVSEVSWRQPDIDWNQFEVVVIRSPWDYQDAPQQFLEVLQTIEDSSAALANSLAMVNWNIDKFYLRELRDKGVPVVPTVWFDRFEREAIEAAIEEFRCDQFVLKPNISANADHTYRLNHALFAEQAETLTKVFSERPFMLQPFMKSVVDEGEYSLFYFNGHYSHTILKQPKPDDFRVQEEHGGQLLSVRPEDELVATAQTSLKALPEIPLYARLDFVRNADRFEMMEAELIEPSLYFNMDEHSAERFAVAFTERFGSGR